MFEGIPKKEWPIRILKGLGVFVREVLTFKTSLKLYLASYCPSLYKPELKEGEILKWKGKILKVPKKIRYLYGIFTLLYI